MYVCCISAGCLLCYLFCSFLGANTFRTIVMASLLEDADCYLDVHIIEDVDVGRLSSENCQFSYCGLVEVPGWLYSNGTFPYGCAYGAGPASNKVKWFCGFGGISFYPSVGFVLSWSWVTLCFWQLSPAHGRYIGLPHKKCLGRLWRYTLWRFQHSRQDGLVSQTDLCLMHLDKGATHAFTSQP